VLIESGLDAWTYEGVQSFGCLLRNNLTKPPANVLELPLEERALMALVAAVEKVIEEHAREGLPLYIWRGGQAVAVPAEELRKRP